MFKKILVPVDGSEPSINAARLAVHMVSKVGGEIHLLYVVKPYAGDYSGVTFTGYQLPEDLAVQVDNEWEKIAHSIVDKVAQEIQSSDIEIHRDIAKGDPVELICKFAQQGNFDLISIGSRGIGGVTGVLGSVSSRVSQNSPCPVIINH